MKHSELHQESIRRPWMLLLPWLGLLLFLVACTEKQPVARSYQIISHDAPTGEWVILSINNEEHTQVEMKVVCDFYKWADHEAVKGPDNCDLIVGRTLVPNPLPKSPRDFLDVWQSGDSLFVTRGTGADRVHQQFSVKSSQVIKR
jgi:hypothetical protein